MVSRIVGGPTPPSVMTLYLMVSEKFGTTKVLEPVPKNFGTEKVSESVTDIFGLGLETSQSQDFPT